MDSKAQVYGIKNCDTVKKALKWLTQNDIEFDFHDFKKEAPSKELVSLWLELIGPQTLVNQRGTTWRKLDESQKSLELSAELVQLLVENSSIIKRPVLKHSGNWSVGFKAETWQKLFGK